MLLSECNYSERWDTPLFKLFGGKDTQEFFFYVIHFPDQVKDAHKAIRNFSNLYWYDEKTVLIKQDSTQDPSWYDDKEAEPMWRQRNEFLMHYYLGKTWVCLEGDFTLDVFYQTNYLPFQSVFDSVGWVLNNKFGISLDRITDGSHHQDFEVDGKKFGGWMGTCGKKYAWEGIGISKELRTDILKGLLPADEQSRVDDNAVSGLLEYGVDIRAFSTELLARIADIEGQYTWSATNAPDPKYYHYGQVVDAYEYAQNMKQNENDDLPQVYSELGDTANYLK